MPVLYVDSAVYQGLHSGSGGIGILKGSRWSGYQSRRPHHFPDTKITDDIENLIPHL